MIRMIQSIFSIPTNRLLAGIFCLLFGLSFSGSHAQILHTESFSVILDTTKTIKGSIVPDFKFQTQKRNLIEFENIADMTVRLNSKSAFTIANKFELTKYGKQTLISGGYLYGEYRTFMEKNFGIEPYVQFQWADARGMETKFASGINGRVHIIKTEKTGLFFGMGPFYEYERWNYNGVEENDIPPSPGTVQNSLVKLGSYLSWKWDFSESLNFDVSVYHQAQFNQLFTTPRLASSSSIRYRITPHLGFILRYQNIYDNAPVVPIDKLFTKVIFTVDISF